MSLRRWIGPAATLATLALLACVNEESAMRAEAGRALVRAATPESFAALLRARYAARRACLDRHFPVTVSVTPGDTSRRVQADYERYVQPYELLRDAGLVTTERVRPGDRDRWPFSAAQVDSGNVMRYVLSERGRRDAEPDTTGGGPGERLCFARRRLVVIDTVVTRGALPGWSPDKGVTYDDTYAYVLHTVAYDSVTEWAPEVARRDSLRNLAPAPEQFEGPQRRWATFWVRDGAWVLTADAGQGPEGADRIVERIARRSRAYVGRDPARDSAARAAPDSAAYAAVDPAVDLTADTAVAAAMAAEADSVATLASRYPRAFANGKPLWHAGGLVSTPREAHQLRTVMSAIPILLVLWWVALSLRALTVDVRRRGTVIVLAGLSGALGWAVLGPLMVSWFAAGLDDRMGDGPALLAALVTACLSAMVMSWGIADPRLESSGWRSRPAPVLVGTEQPTTPTIPTHLRPGLVALCHFTMAGTALGLLVVGVAYGYYLDAVRPGLPERFGLAIAALGVVAGVRGLVSSRD